MRNGGVTKTTLLIAFNIVWFLIMTSFVVDPYLIYEVVTDPEDDDQIPPFWERIAKSFSFRQAAFFLPLLIFFPFSEANRNYYLHAIGIVSLALGLSPLIKSHWTEDTVHDFLDVEGIISGRAAVIYLGILLLTTSRKSVLLTFLGSGYIDLIAVHRTAGWWCVAMSIIHSLAYVIYYIVEGGARKLLSECFPTKRCFRDGHWEKCLNFGGTINFFGLIGTIAVLFLAFFSREVIRRNMFERFYIIHLITSAIFIFFVALHDYGTILLAFAGLTFYAYDRFNARRTRSHHSSFTAELITDNIVMLKWNATSQNKLMPGTRWVYVQIENISTMEWHPISCVQVCDHTYTFVKGLGDWSSSLCDLVSSKEKLRINIEGPFGSSVIGVDTPRTLIIIAGGVGVSPFIDFLCNIPDESCWSRIKFIWAVRSNEYRALSEIIDFESISSVADVCIFITSQVKTERAFQSQERGGISVSKYDATVFNISSILSYAMIIISTALITGCAWASSHIHDKIYDDLYDDVSTLMKYVFALRVAPVLISLAFAILSSFGLFIIHKMKNSYGRIKKSDWTVQLAAEECTPYGPPRVQNSRPNLKEEIEGELDSGPMEIQVCGPKRMIDDVVQTVETLRLKKHDIRLHVHDSAI